MVKNEYKSFFGRQWVKIFYHNMNTGFYINDFSKFLHSEEKNNFSVFDEVTDLYRFNEMFEFALDYGSLGFIAWRQNANPINVYKENETQESIDLHIISNINKWEQFIGLMRSKSGSSFLDCQSDLGGYWYSVGTKGYTRNKIPGPIKNGIGYELDEVTLWLRIPYRACSIPRNICTSSLFNIFLLTFVISS